MRSRSESAMAIWLVCVGIGLLFLARGARLSQDLLGRTSRELIGPCPVAQELPTRAPVSRRRDG